MANENLAVATSKSIRTLVVTKDGCGLIRTRFHVLVHAQGVSQPLFLDRSVSRVHTFTPDNAGPMETYP